MCFSVLLSFNHQSNELLNKYNWICDRCNTQGMRLGWWAPPHPGVLPPHGDMTNF